MERIGRNLLIPYNRAYVDYTIGWKLEGAAEGVVPSSCVRSDPHALSGGAESAVARRRRSGMSAGRHVPHDRTQPPAGILQSTAGAADGAPRRAHRGVGDGARSARNTISAARIASFRTASTSIAFTRTTNRTNEWQSRDKVNIVFVGRLDPRKGVDHLIAAVPRVVERTRWTRPLSDRRRLVSAQQTRGRGAARHARARRRSSVRLPAADLPRWFATADIFVSPATGNESFGIVLLEAMAAGKPVVCSDIPGYRSVVIPDQNGVLHAPNDVDALADALSGLVEDEDHRTTLSINGRKRALEFAWPRVTDEIEAVYQSLVDAPSKSRRKQPARPRARRRERAELSTTRPLFRQRSFAALWWGQIFSITGDRFTYLALAGLFYEHSRTDLGGELCRAACGLCKRRDRTGAAVRAVHRCVGGPAQSEARARRQRRDARLDRVVPFRFCFSSRIRPTSCSR